jgi:hypothetical protein
MNWQLCELFKVGGSALLNDDQELALLRVRHKLVAMRVPFMYETRDEYETRKGKGHLWEPLLRVWRGLSVQELNALRC